MPQQRAVRLTDSDIPVLASLCHRRTGHDFGSAVLVLVSREQPWDRLVMEYAYVGRGVKRGVKRSEGCVGGQRDRILTVPGVVAW